MLFDVTTDYRRPTELYRIDPVTRVETRIRGIDLLRVRDLRLSPDGRKLAFTAGTERKDDGVWLLENFLPTSKAPAVSKPVAPTEKK